MKNKWTKFRHKVTRFIAYPIAKFLIKKKTGIKLRKFKGTKGPYVILYNHQTGYDQFALSLCFKFPIYHVASDDIFTLGFASKLVNYCFSPIPIKKNVSDIGCVRTCIKVIKEGGTVVLAPEGNRTFSGETCYFNPAIVGMVKLLKTPVIIFKIEGGYNALPRWADKKRKGNANAYVSTIISPQEIQDLSKEELLERLKKELYNNDYDMQENFVGNNKAEYLERVAYVCPNCGLSEFESDKNLIRCKKCDLTVEYQEDKSLKVLKGNFAFNNYLEWYNYQNEFINKLDLLNQKQTLFYEDSARILKVVPCKRRVLLQKNSQIKLYGDRITATVGGIEKQFAFEDLLGVSVLGKNKLNVYVTSEEIYQIKGSERFNAVKYLNFYHRYLNQVKQDGSEFLGL